MITVFYYQHNDITYASYSLKSPVDRLFVQQVVQPGEKENIKGQQHWPPVRGIRRSPLGPPHKGPVICSFEIPLVSLSWRNCWTISWVAGDLRRHDAHVLGLFRYFNDRSRSPSGIFRSKSVYEYTFYKASTKCQLRVPSVLRISLVIWWISRVTISFVGKVSGGQPLTRVDLFN